MTKLNWTGLIWIALSWSLTAAAQSGGIDLCNYPGSENLPVCAGAGSGSSPGGAGTWTHSSYGNDYGTRDFYLYVPKQLPNGPVPLLVMLHGCVEGAADIAHNSGLNLLADQGGFVILYPEESSAYNQNRCWNWFQPENFRKGGGETGIILGMIATVRQSVTIDPARIYVGGFSAGAAMAANLLACNADFFAGAVIHSGLEYEAASSMNEAFTAMSAGSKTDPIQAGTDAARCSGPGAHIPKVLIIQGSSDTTVNPSNADKLVAQFTQMNNMIDGGSGNQTTAVLQTQNGTAPGGRSYTIEGYGGNGAIHIAKVLVNGMGHAWSGGAQAQFSDPQGPSASQMTVNFLMTR